MPACLQHLSLAHCKQVTAAGLAHLSGLLALEQLSLRACCQLRDPALAHLVGLTALKAGISGTAPNASHR